MYKTTTLILMISAHLYALGQTIPDTSMQNKQDSTVQPATDTSVQAFPGKTFTANQEVYKLKAASDIPITAIGTGWSLYAFTKIYSKDKSSEEKIISLDKKDSPSLDRQGAEVFHPEASETGNTMSYRSMPSPLVLLLDND